jgi:hypothetical protein
MQPSGLSRRGFCGMGATVASAGTLSSAAWAQTVAARVGVQTADLPNLCIKEVKAYSTGSGRLASIVTQGGVEGNCTLQDQVFHADWDMRGWVEYAKHTLAGKDALDHLQLTSQFIPVRRHYGQNPYASPIDRERRTPRQGRKDRAPLRYAATKARPPAEPSRSSHPPSDAR